MRLERPSISSSRVCTTGRAPCSDACCRPRIRYPDQRNSPPLITPDRFLRGALWTSVGLNALGVLVFAPLAVGRPSLLLPVPASPFLAGQVGLVIGIFGGVYLWLARRATIDGPLLVVGGIGKLGFFALAVAYAAAGHIPAQVAASALPDLVLGAIFLRAGRAAPA